MKKISEAVEQLVLNSETAYEAMRRGWLNLSAYADEILPQVEALTWKEVGRQSVVVSLSRLAQQVRSAPALMPQIRLDQLSIRSPLADVTFEKTAETVAKAHKLSDKIQVTGNHFLTITQGVDEITIIVTASDTSEVLALMHVTPKMTYDDVVGLTMTFAESFTTEPNVIYGILSVLAVKSINILEIVSTYTALTVVIHKKDLELALSQLQPFFEKTNKKLI